MFAYGETISVLTAGERVDEYSQETVYDDWDNPTSLDIPHVAVAAGGSSLVAEPARDGVDADFDLFFPTDAVVTTANRVIVRGLECDVAGLPFLWSNPFTGWTPGLVVQVKIREG